MGKFIQYLSFGLVLFLSSCAQVGSISGGQNDETPPKLVENGTNPPNGTLNFQSKTVEFKFDEFIKLNNPTETISLVPADAKIKAEYRKKTLTLTIDGDLKPETTYAIYLNGTVQDITESNDSLMQYVFSTGNFIDTLKYSGFVTDAFTYKPIKDVFVGLYQNTDSSFFKKPSYFGKTDASGRFDLFYVKPGTYKILAFEDKNRDMILQKSERVGFADQLVQIDSAVIDSIPMRVFSQPGTRKIKAAYQGPSLLNIGSNRSLDSAKFLVDGVEIKTINHTFKKDSVSLLIDHQNKNELQLIVQTKEAIDTLNIKTWEKERSKNVYFETNLKNGSIPIGEKLQIRFTDYITSFDTSLIQLINSDSIKLNYSFNLIQPNTIEVTIDSNQFKELNLKLLQNSILFKNSKEISNTSISIKNKFERDFGSILLMTKDLPDYALIEILKTNNIVRIIPRKNIGEQLLVSYLEPDNYTFRVILDKNQNGKWDEGSFDGKIQPEEILFFTKGVKVRANWEMEVTLIPEK